MNSKINETLEKDTELRFPHIYSVEASAGSGKTYTLTLRVLQFLLSGNIPNNKLTNILGITFTNNSAKDMKRQVLEKLKSMSLGLLDAGTAQYISDITTFGGRGYDSHPSNAAENLIDRILSNYHDFQIRTIDSFTSKILKASAAEIGLPPDFEISTESSAVAGYAVLNMVESADSDLLAEFLDLLNRNQTGGGLDFNPVKSIKDGMKRLLETESDYNEEFSFDFSFKAKLDENLKPAIDGLKDLLKTAERNGFEIKGNVKKETIDKIKNYLDDKNYFGLVNERKGFPYKKQKSVPDNVDYSKKWEELLDGFDKYLPDIAKLKSLPYLTLYESFKKELRNAYKILGLVYISDINKKLNRFLSESSVPEIYFHLGNVIEHYFIDEFQDTSKVQWQNLKPLIEESLSKGGSLFTVGDLKQALYGFRGADYKIMKSLNDGGGKSFPSLNEFKKVSLKINFRSDKALVDYVNRVFKNALKHRVEYVGDPAGFLTYEQDTPLDEAGNNINAGGYCAAEIFKYPDGSKENKSAGAAETDADNADSGGNDSEETQNGASAGNPLDLIEQRLIEIIEDLKARGYDYGAIAVLAQKNRYLNDIGGRLIEKGYPVVTQSSLDIRNRKVIREIEMLLSFLNSPVDDFNFGSFILGDIFEKKSKFKSGRKEFEKFIFEVNSKNIRSNQNPLNNRSVPDEADKTVEFYEAGKSDEFYEAGETDEAKRPLYIEFRERYESLWNECFEELFNKTGYLPPYEIVLYIYKVFNIPENFSEESAYLAHFLDAIQSAEEKGLSNLNDFLDLINSNNSDNSKDGAGAELFSIELPEVKDALTLLTVHKAKGLQWGAVVNVFFAEENYALRTDPAKSKSNKGAKKNYFTAGTETGGGSRSLDLLYITKKMFEGKKGESSKSPYLESVYYEAAKDENISDLNTLYVALTRAKHEMYNLIISKEECPFPAGSAGEKPLRKPEDKDKNRGEKDGESAGGDGSPSAGNGNMSGRGGIELDCGYCDIGLEYAIKTGGQYLSIKRGDFYHKVLSEIKYVEDFENLDALIEKYIILLRIKNNRSKSFETITGVKEKILRIKENSFLLKFFDKEIYEIFTEKEYLSATGGVCRMDRVSVSEKSGEICILDYKTGDMNKKEAESYKIQLLRYKSILKDIYKDKKISAIIYNIDKGGLLEC